MPAPSAHVDGLLEERSPDTAPPVTRRHHQAEVGDVAARGMKIAGEREPSDEAVPIGRDVDRRVGMPAHGPQIPAFIGDAPPGRRRQKPRALLAADLARELDERLRIARIRAADADHGTTTP